MAAVKDVARQVIESLPDDASMDDLIHALYIREKFERGLSAVREGKGIPHEVVKRRLSKWRR